MSDLFVTSQNSFSRKGKIGAKFVRKQVVIISSVSQVLLLFRKLISAENIMFNLKPYIFTTYSFIVTGKNQRTQYQSNSQMFSNMVSLPTQRNKCKYNISGLIAASKDKWRSRIHVVGKMEPFNLSAVEPVEGCSSSSSRKWRNLKHISCSCASDGGRRDSWNIPFHPPSPWP